MGQYHGIIARACKKQPVQAFGGRKNALKMRKTLTGAKFVVKNKPETGNSRRFSNEY
jgi:hypothetical protein